ncbi:MAG: ribosome recycling factor [Clostridia bacterium]|nr:ribosome recycling factor [Clostridia bacterium]
MAIDLETLEMMELECEERMLKSLDVLKAEVLQVRAGRANPHILDKIQLEAYGGMSPINQIGNISVVDAQCLMISPWDKSLLKSVEKAIQLSNIGINPTNDGNVIRLVFPMLTDERRREIVKQVKKMGEDGKVAIRNIRRDGLDGFKKLKTAKEITEDQYAEYESAIEKLTQKTVEAIDKVIADKEKELLTV